MASIETVIGSGDEDDDIKFEVRVQRTKGDPERAEISTEVAHAAPCDSKPIGTPQRDDDQAKERRPWKKIAMGVGSVVVIVAGTVVVTLLATKASAVEMNAKAYINGLNDGYSQCQNDQWW